MACCRGGGGCCADSSANVPQVWVCAAGGSSCDDTVEGKETFFPSIGRVGLGLVLTLEQFEDNNTAIGHAGLVQALVLWQDVGFWSGNRRKMEIAECHLVIPITVRWS